MYLLGFVLYGVISKGDVCLAWWVWVVGMTRVVGDIVVIVPRERGRQYLPYLPAVSLPRTDFSAGSPWDQKCFCRQF